MSRPEHILGGDRCREYFGAAHGHCGQPAADGLCDAHADSRVDKPAEQQPSKWDEPTPRHLAPVVHLDSIRYRKGRNHGQ